MGFRPVLGAMGVKRALLLITVSLGLAGCEAFKRSPYGRLLFRMAPNVTANRDRCSFIQGLQYPYDWSGSREGVCVRQLPDRVVTKMVPDSIGGLFMEPRQVRVRGGLSIESPFGNGVGKWNGGRGNLVGTINTNDGSFYFACDGVAVTGTDRGICYWQQ